MTLNTKDIKTFNEGWEEVFGTKPNIVETVGHATRVVPGRATIDDLKRKLEKIEQHVRGIRKAPSGLAKGLKVQYLLSLFNEESGKMK